MIYPQKSCFVTPTLGYRLQRLTLPAWAGTAQVHEYPEGILVQGGRIPSPPGMDLETAGQPSKASDEPRIKLIKLIKVEKCALCPTGDPGARSGRRPLLWGPQMKRS